MNPTRNRSNLAIIPVLAMCVGLLLGTRSLADGVTEEHWYVVEMQGQRCGHMLAQTVQQGDRFMTRGEMTIEVGRAGSVTRISISTESVETADGKPIKMRSEMRMGSLPTVDEYLFKADGVEMTHSVVGSKHSEKKPLPEGEWMTSTAAERYVAGQIAAGAKEIVVRTIGPSNGLTPMKTKMRFQERTMLDVVGKTVPAIKWTTSNDLMPKMETTDFTDERGVPLRTEMDIGGIKMVLMRADKALALSKASPPELLESTFIVPDKQIKSARESTAGVFVLKSDGGLMGDWPSAGAQTAEKADEGAVRIRVERARSSEATKAEMESPEFRKPSSMVNSTDERVVALKDEAMKGLGKASGSERAESLRTFVYRHINKKSFDVGFASAAETARTRCGDCTEHAVLLCALLRAADMPARCVSGLVYVDGIGKGGKGAFGYHMWTQVMLPEKEGGGQRWHDLDAALDVKRPIDATHIAIQTLSLADGQTVNALMEILPTLGKLRIVVEKVESKGAE